MEIPTKARHILCIGDLHAGSSVALLPPDFIASDGNKICLNESQKWLWGRLCDAMRAVRKHVGTGRLAIVFGGDAIEGCHHDGLNMSLRTEEDQLDAAQTIVRYIIKESGAKETYVLFGTACHVGSLESAIAERHGTEATSALILRTPNGAVHLTHHITTSSRAYLEAGMLSAHMGHARIERARMRKDYIPTWVRFHRHRFGLFDDGQGQMIACPSWKLLDRYVHKVCPGSIPQVGCVLLDYSKAANEMPAVIRWLWECES
jgi:hypothetical protein